MLNSHSIYWKRHSSCYLSPGGATLYKKSWIWNQQICSAETDVQQCQKSWKLVQAFWRHKQMWAFKRSGLTFFGPPCILTLKIKCTFTGSHLRTVTDADNAGRHSTTTRVTYRQWGEQLERYNTHLTALCPWLPGSQYQKGKTNLELLEQEIVSGSGITWATYKSVHCPRLTMPASHNGLDALAAQPTASKHWRHNS